MVILAKFSKKDDCWKEYGMLHSGTAACPSLR